MSDDSILHSQTSRWWREIRYSGGIYTAEIGKYYKAGLVPPTLHTPES